jgi:N-acetylmuramoyl-L-alanine amidase
MRATITQPPFRAGQSLVLASLALFAAAAIGIGWWYISQRVYPVADHLSVYYTQLDGSTEASWSALLGPAHDPQSVVFFAATQAIAGPPSGIEAVRFPQGTYVRSADLTGSTVVVDLSKEVDRLAGGSFRESATFKSLVWTLTALPGITAVRISVDGARVAAIPGGHFELDEPLTRSSW